MELTKEECEIAIERIKKSYSKGVFLYDYDETKLLEQLINEHFDNQPLEIEDIKEEDVLWDDHSKEYVLVKTLLDDELVLAYFDWNFQKVTFRKGRFYRKEINYVDIQQ